eukprot:m.356246 g.356246  ORF g.356246 m.356246 type:complete len:120 (+) comp20749_c0_seq5:725-1084(+)
MDSRRLPNTEQAPALFTQRACSDECAMQGTRMVAWLKHMYSVNDNITLLGSVWSPPQWMKSGTTLDMGHADAWVAYFIKYLEAFRTAGVHVNAVTLQNEPLHSADPAWTMSVGMFCMSA